MHLVSLTSHSPSAVLYSLSCSFRESDERYLAILTADKLQIHSLKSHGIELVCEQEIWGQPRGLIQLKTSKHLVVALDIPQAKILVLDFNPRSSQLSVHHTSIISPLAHRPSVNFSGILGGGQSLCASFYSGHVKVVEVEPKAPYKVKESDLRVHELAIQSMCYTLPSSDKLVAIAYTDSTGRGWVIGRTADGMNPTPLLPEKELEIIPESIIPVQIENPGEDNTCGVLLFASHTVTFIKTGAGYFSSEETGQSAKGKGKVKPNRNKSEIRADIQASMVTVNVPCRDVAAWTQVDGKHLIIGDSLGQLHLLTMSMEPQFTVSCTFLGETSVPSTLSYLSNNILYVGSLSGPSQIVRISDEITNGEDSVSRGKKKQPDDEATYLEVLAEHNENIAPIWDATLVEVDGSGQPRIAIISGDESGGCLSIVHKGASFRELAILDGSGNFDNIFPLKKYFDAHEHSYLVASTTTSTFILYLANSSVTLLSPDELPGISRNGSTILASNLALAGIDTAIHVMSNNVVLVDLITGGVISTWKPPKGDITAAALDTPSSTLCIATSQGYLFSLNTQPAGFVKLSEVNFKTRHAQISSLSINARIIAAAFWGSNEIKFFSLPELRMLEKSTMEEPSAASAVHLSNLGGSQTYLIAARLDGAVVVQAITPQGELVPDSRRVVPLGGGPIHITTTTGSPTVQVVAAGKHATSLSIINKRLSVSSLSISDVCALAAVNAPGLGHSIAYVSGNRLVFGQIEQLNKLNISKASTNLGNDTPLCLAHHAGLSNYAIGCARSKSDTLEERHFVRFLDDSTFKDLGQHKLKYSEMITSVGTYTHGTNSYILAGTAIVTPGETEPLSGRIILFGREEESSMIKFEASKDVEGGVSSIKQLGARIIAAIGHGVYLYNIGKDQVTISNPVARWERGYLVQDVIVRPSMIVVSDKLRSVSVIRLVERTEISDSVDLEEEESTILQFETVAMDMHAVWPTSIEVLSDNKTIIASQVDGNILTWELDDKNLEPRAAFHTGEVIHKFIASTAKSATLPRTVAIFVTSTGRIGTLSTVGDADALHLTRLEMKMNDAIKGLGEIDHAEWRAPKLLHTGAKPPPRRGVTDGDFIKRFLELDPSEAKKILSAGSAAESIGPAEEAQIRRCLDAISVEQ